MCRKRTYKVKEIVEFIESSGFIKTRIRGSHNQFHNHKGVLVTVPGKENDVLDQGTLCSILRQAQLKIQ
jgi:predicted RNA binding protein YcfA (HicA-like mRNA interferase family)